MKSKKNEELNFLYLDDKYNESKKKNTPAKKQQRKKANKKSKSTAKEDEVFNFDNEIVIGVTKIPEETEKKKKNNSKTKVKKHIDTPKKKENKEKNEGADKKSAPRNINKKIEKNKKENKKNSFIKNVIKWTSLLCALVAAFIFFMMSPLFDIVEVNVTGNQAISKESIISISEIKIGENIYKTSKRKIEEKIKRNAYIDDVEIKRILPNKIELTVKERKATYMLQYANSFAYINNQGYILEINQQKLELPIITGFITSQEELKVGSRLQAEDLNRLETVLKIVESINANGIESKINRIDIANNQNYTFYMEEEKKIVYLGDASNLSSRMLYLKAALEDTKGLEGELFINGDLIKEKAFFRQKE